MFGVKLWITQGNAWICTLHKDTWISFSIHKLHNSPRISIILEFTVSKVQICEWSAPTIDQRSCNSIIHVASVMKYQQLTVHQLLTKSNGLGVWWFDPVPQSWDCTIVAQCVDRQCSVHLCTLCTGNAQIHALHPTQAYQHHPYMYI